MKYCQYCGNELNENQDVCLNCGRRITKENPVNDTGGIGWGILGFFVPVVGLILFLIWKDDQPKNAKAAGIGALISFILRIVIYILYFILIFATFS